MKNKLVFHHLCRHRRNWVWSVQTLRWAGRRWSSTGCATTQVFRGGASALINVLFVFLVLSILSCGLLTTRVMERNQRSPKNELPPQSPLSACHPPGSPSSWSTLCAPHCQHQTLAIVFLFRSLLISLIWVYCLFCSTCGEMGWETVRF